MALDIAITKPDPRSYRVKLTGSLDNASAPVLDKRMEEVASDAYARVLHLELHDLAFISSAGLASIARIKKAMTSRGGVMLVIGAQPQITRVFDIVKMLPKESVFTSRQEADAYLAAIQKNVIEENRPNPA